MIELFLEFCSSMQHCAGSVAKNDLEVSMTNTFPMGLVVHDTISSVFQPTLLSSCKSLFSVHI